MRRARKTLRLHLGDSFDVTANRKRTDFEGLGNCTFESSHEIRIVIAKSEPDGVLVT